MSHRSYDRSLQDELLDWRGVDDPCPACKGSGVKHYANTSTWRHSMGGASMTLDVCDICWGTGDVHRIGVDLRKQRDEEAVRVAEAAVSLLARSVGAHLTLTVTAPALKELISELNKLSRGRTERPRFFYDITASLASTLQRAVTAAAERNKL